MKCAISRNQKILTQWVTSTSSHPLQTMVSYHHEFYRRAHYFLWVQYYFGGSRPNGQVQLFYPLGHPYIAKSVALLFIKYIFKLHGLPHSIISERDSTFTSNFWKDLFTTQGVKLSFSTTYHPQKDDLSEVVNKTLETYLRYFVENRPRDQVKWVSLA